MHYATARVKREANWQSWRIYMAEQARLTPQGKAWSMPWHEIIKPKKIDKRTGDEIALDVIEKMGLEVR